MVTSLKRYVTSLRQPAKRFRKPTKATSFCVVSVPNFVPLLTFKWPLLHTSCFFSHLFSWSWFNFSLWPWWWQERHSGSLFYWARFVQPWAEYFLHWKEILCSECQICRGPHYANHCPDRYARPLGNQDGNFAHTFAS